MEKLNRKKFFSFITKTTFLTSLATVLPTKFLSSINKVVEKKVSIKINPEAIKRNKV